MWDVSLHYFYLNDNWLLLGLWEDIKKYDASWNTKLPNST